jgi:hypothetical protein
VGSPLPQPGVMGGTYNISHPVNLPFKAKEELWKLKYFTMQKYNLQKNIL